MNTQPSTLSSNRSLKLFSGRANTELAAEIAKHLGISLGEVRMQNFSDGELYIKVMESVRRDDVFIVQPTSPPANENLVELLILIDAIKRASAETITVVIPYYGYSRQDRKATGREPITAKLIANLLAKAGADRIVALDLHASQIMGFFDTLVDHLHASPVLADYVKTLKLENMVVVSPDVGGVARAREFAKRLGEAPLAIIDKRRSTTEQNKVEVFNLIGEVNGKNCIIIDDIIDTAGTICKAAKLLLDRGARNVYACASHGVLSGPGIQNLVESPITEVIITNSIKFPQAQLPAKIRQLSVAGLLGEVIRRIYAGNSVSSMFE